MKSGHWAKVTVHQFSKMKPKLRLAIRHWLMDLAEDLRVEPDKFSDRFSARFMK